MHSKCEDEYIRVKKKNDNERKKRDDSAWLNGDGGKEEVYHA